MFVHHHAQLLLELTQFLSQYGIRHKLKNFDAANMKQAPQALEGYVGQILCFGFDLWPRDSYEADVTGSDPGSAPGMSEASMPGASAHDEHRKTGS